MASPILHGGVRDCPRCGGRFDVSGFHGPTATYCKPCNLQYLKGRRYAARDRAETYVKENGKTCVQCGQLKAAAAFRPSKKEQDRHAARCIECQQGLKADRIARKVPKKKAYWKKSKYGISESRYNEMLGAQGYACAVCLKPHSTEKVLCIDHDHSSGRVRGLLCSHCNTAIGYFRDSPMFCRAAAVYLENHHPDREMP